MCIPALAAPLVGTAATSTMGSAAALAAMTGGYAGSVAALGLTPTAGLFGAGGAFTLSGLSNMASILGQGFSAYSQYQQGKYQEGMARYNKRIAEIKAADALERGREAALKHRRQVSQLMGEQRAGLAASGFDVGAGSALDVLNDTATFGEQDALTIEANAEREAWGYRVQGEQDTAQASLYRSAGNLGSVSSLLAGSGMVARQWYDYRR